MRASGYRKGEDGDCGKRVDGDGERSRGFRASFSREEVGQGKGKWVRGERLWSLKWWKVERIVPNAVLVLVRQMEMI